MRRNDIIPIDSRSHLEVADRKHRYAKNLRVYFKEYHRLNGITDIVDQPTNSNGSSTPSRKLARYNPFFEWLDNEDSLPNLPECPRSVLDEDKVEYLTTDAERAPYEIIINGGATGGDGLWRLASNGEPVNTGPKGWIFVLLFDRMFACEKRTNTFPRFHHSSFFAGAGVSAAGMVVCVNGKLTKLFPHSGHYRPHDRHLYLLLGYLRDKGVALSGVQVDVQRVMKLSRQTEKDGAKARKTECALYMDGETAYSFLRSKNSFLEGGVLKQINRRRLQTAVAAESTTGVEAASSVDCGSASAKEGGVECTALSIGDCCVVSAPSPLNDVLGSAGMPQASTEAKVFVALTSTDQDSGAAEAKRQSGDYASSELNRSISSASTSSPFCSPVASYQYRFSRDMRAPSPDHSTTGAGAGAGAGAGNGVPSSSSGSGKSWVNAVSGGGSGGAGSAREDQPAYPQPPAQPVFGVKSSVFSGSSPGSGDDLQQASSGSGSGSNRHSGHYGAAPVSGYAGYAGLHISSPSPGGGSTAAESRARLLGSMLYSNSGGNSGGNGGTSGNGTPGSGHKKSGTLPGTLPVSPPVAPPAPTASRSNSLTGAYATTGSGGIASSPSGQLKIPVPAPIKKVTSYTSISSSYGSTSYLASYFNRSRSASKADDAMDYDIRILLGDSPVVPAPLMDANYNFYASSDANSTSSPNATSAVNSNCASRARSRCSSFNPPFGPGSVQSTAAYANSNFNYAITESSVLHRLNSNNSNGNSGTSTSVYYAGSAANAGAGAGVWSHEYSEEFQLLGGSSGSASVQGRCTTKDTSPATSADSSPVDKLKGAFSAGAGMAGSGSGKLSISAVQYVSVGAQGGVSSATASVASSRGKTLTVAVESPRRYSGSNASGAGAGAGWSTPSSRGSQQALQLTSERSPTNKITAVALVLHQAENPTLAEPAGRDAECPSSPVPSFASSLSSTDSMSNMLDLLLSPAGAQQRRRDSEGQGGGCYRHGYNEDVEGAAEDLDQGYSFTYELEHSGAAAGEGLLPE